MILAKVLTSVLQSNNTKYIVENETIAIELPATSKFTSNSKSDNNKVSFPLKAKQKKKQGRKYLIEELSKKRVFTLAYKL